MLLNFNVSFLYINMYIIDMVKMKFISISLCYLYSGMLTINVTVYYSHLTCMIEKDNNLIGVKAIKTCTEAIQYNRLP